MASGYTLVIGTKNWSSWSLRPWLLMKASGLAFREIEITLRQTESQTLIARYSPSGKVPALLIGDVHRVWDSLAICETLAARHPEMQLWPGDEWARAEARSISAEMHSGFAALRKEMPMDCMARLPLPVLSDDAKRDIARIRTVWSGVRARHGTDGPFLFGAFSIADAMYAPVVSRFITYGVALSAPEQAYADAIWAMPAMAHWLAACAAWQQTEAQT